MSVRSTQFPPPHPQRISPSILESSNLARRLAKQVNRDGGRALVVGGFVRDFLWGQPHGDLDLEVYGLSPKQLETSARAVGPTRLVGRDFGILKVGQLDVSLPRVSRKPGLEGFLLSEPSLTLTEAAQRRDFTLNSMAWDPLTGDLFDPFHGIDDLHSGILRHVAPETFVEDPLRALRAIQFIARFPIEPAPETLSLCKSLAQQLPALPRERLFEELRKLLLRGKRIGHALEIARKIGIVAHLWPELETLVGCPQDVKWHPEGDVWTHTCLALDAATKLRSGTPTQDLAMMVAVLCHDLGKPGTTVHESSGHIRSLGHEALGASLTKRFISRITDDRKLNETVIPLVELHLRPQEVYKQKASDAAVRRLATHVNIDLLTRVARADALGRTTTEALQGQFPAGDWLLDKAAQLAVQNHQPQPLVLGRHLMDLGIAPGPALGDLLKRLFESQLEGRFLDLEGGLAEAQSLMNAKTPDPSDKG